MRFGVAAVYRPKLTAHRGSFLDKRLSSESESRYLPPFPRCRTERHQSGSAGGQHIGNGPAFDCVSQFVSRLKKVVPKPRM